MIVQIIKVVLFLFGTGRNGHVIAIDLAEVLVIMLHTKQQMPLEGNFSGGAIDGLAHDATYTKVMINGKFSFLVRVFPLQFQELLLCAF